MSVNTYLYILIVGQRKAFYRQRTPENCARKETVDIDILETSRNGDREIMESIRITSRPTSMSSMSYAKDSFSKQV